MQHGSPDGPGTGRSLRDTPFAELVELDPDLADARRHYAAASPARRRAAAEWEYDSALAGSLFADALERTDGTRWPPDRLEDGVLALAIDPLFAPALLTVGSIEYQCGRPEAAMEHFLALTALPEDEPDIEEIVDKAGCFLLDQKDYPNALRLYEAAAHGTPAAATYWSGVGCSLTQLGRHGEGVDAMRRAVEIEPTNASWLNDLGWSLVQAGQYEEARTVLERAAALAPEDFDLPRDNLSDLERRMSEGGAG